jgi:hypothetical protein
MDGREARECETRCCHCVRKADLRGNDHSKALIIENVVSTFDR